MSDMKCPFCQQELEPQTIDGGWLECWNCSYSEPNSKHLPQPILAGSKELWQELILTRKALEIAKDTIRHTDWFFDGDYNLDAKTMHSEIKCAIKGITALEQKDVK